MEEELMACFGEEQGNFFLQHVKRSRPFQITNHYHNTYEIYYLYKGNRNYFIHDRSYSVSPGSLVMINKNCTHKTSDKGKPGHERMLLQFNEDFLNKLNNVDCIDLLKPFQSGPPVIELKYQERVFTEDLLGKLSREVTTTGYGYDLYARILLTELLLFISRVTAMQEASPVGNVSMLHNKISEIVQFINTHYDSKITLTSLAEQFYISTSYFSRSFKQVTGFNFVEYLNVIRIKEAKKRIAESKINITEISAQVGFDNLCHFERTFKKIAKLTPMQYKKMTKGLVSGQINKESSEQRS